MLAKQLDIIYLLIAHKYVTYDLVKKVVLVTPSILGNRLLVCIFNVNI